MLDAIKTTLVDAFRKKMGSDATWVVFSPGRINLIGEHTDYNDGFVLPAAIDLGVYFALRKRNDDLVRFHSLDFNTDFSFSIQKLPENANGNVYLLGVLALMLENEMPTTCGFDCVALSTLPVGAGLSSSAAFTAGLIFALNHAFQLHLPAMKMAEMAQTVEHRFAGVRCGIMDSFANLFSKEKHATLLDCRDLSFRYVPFDFPEHSILLINTKIKHSLAESAYNERRAACEKGVAELKKHKREIRSLRDVSLDMLDAHEVELGENIVKKCRYVVQEIARVQAACQDLALSNLKAFGEKMYETHWGLSRDYEVSCTELDALVSYAQTCKGVLGSRMMGGGFGGCTINLIENSQCADFQLFTQEKFRTQFGFEPSFIHAQLGSGTRLV